MIIIETPDTHPGIRLYVVRVEASGRRPKYELIGQRAEAAQFEDEATAYLAIMQFSSLYGLVMTEI
jgi:hypothetical protein